MPNPIVIYDAIKYVEIKSVIAIGTVLYTPFVSTWFKYYIVFIARLGAKYRYTKYTKVHPKGKILRFVGVFIFFPSFLAHLFI